MLKFTFCKKTVLTTLILLVFIEAYTQTPLPLKSATTKEIIDFTELIYGNDDRLICGQVYQPKHFRAKGNPYFINDRWQKGRLFIKGNIFDDVNIKYDIELNKIILKAELKNGNVRHLILNNQFIDSLFINKHLFVNSALLPVQEASGFYEQLYKGNFTAYLKYEVTFRKESSAIAPFGKYLKPKSILCIYWDNKIEKLTNIKLLLNCFPTKQKEIKKYIRRNSMRFKKSDNNQLFNLLKYCDEISSKSKV